MNKSVQLGRCQYVLLSARPVPIQVRLLVEDTIISLILGALKLKLADLSKGVGGVLGLGLDLNELYVAVESHLVGCSLGGLSINVEVADILVVAGAKAFIDVPCTQHQQGLYSYSPMALYV